MFNRYIIKWTMFIHFPARKLLNYQYKVVAPYFAKLVPVTPTTLVYGRYIYTYGL